MWDGIPDTTLPHRHEARPPSSVRTPLGGVRDGSSRMLRTARHVSSPTSGSQSPWPTMSPLFGSGPAILGFSRMVRIDCRVHVPVLDWTGRTPAAVHSRITPDRLPPPSSSAHAPATAAASAGSAVDQQRYPNGRGPPSGRFPPHRRRLIRQFLPLGLALLLGLGHRDQDPGGQPPGVGAQVDDPVRFGEPHPGLIEPGDQVLQVQRLAQRPVPLPAQNHIHRPGRRPAAAPPPTPAGTFPAAVGSFRVTPMSLSDSRYTTVHPRAQRPFLQVRELVRHPVGVTQPVLADPGVDQASHAIAHVCYYSKYEPRSGRHHHRQIPAAAQDPLRTLEVPGWRAHLGSCDQQVPMPALY